MDQAKQMTADEKWEVVKPVYQTAYRLKFRSRPTDVQIEWMFEKMNQLTLELYQHSQLPKPKARDHAF